MFQIRVHGTPAPQGSKRAIVNRHTQRAVLIEDNKRTAPWRAAVVETAIDACKRRLTGALQARITFIMPRPKSHYRTGRNADQLKDSAPRRPMTKPDLDKLIRSTLDALNDAGIFHDDSQICTIVAAKVYESETVGLPGATISVFEIGEK